MSEKLPALTGNELIKVLEKIGFVVSRIRGSHHVLKHPEGKTTVVPGSFWRNHRAWVATQNYQGLWIGKESIHGPSFLIEGILAN